MLTVSRIIKETLLAFPDINSCAYSKKQGTCYYRKAGSSKRCAVGRYLDDKTWNSMPIEAKVGPIARLTEFFPTIPACLKIKNLTSSQAWAFWDELQKIHDTFAQYSKQKKFNEDFKPALLQLTQHSKWRH